VRPGCIVLVLCATSCLEGQQYVPPRPDAGTPSPLTIGNWNLEWFGDLENGPTDESRQLENVRQVLAREPGVDLWAFQEIVSEEHFRHLVESVPGSAGFAASDPSVVGGPASFSADELKVALMYRTDTVQVVDRRVILDSEEDQWAFVWRPPLRVDLRVGPGETKHELIVIVVHLKALATAADWERRKTASGLLKGYLDRELPLQRVVVLGDFNDDVDQSIVYDTSTRTYLDTPFRALVDATDDYRFVTEYLSSRGENSIVSYSQMIDHQLITRELEAWYVPFSVRVLKPDEWQLLYTTQTSDHRPVLADYELP
jgi:endonuclease/exonuclease/phosphatase family metal-dependent hydrolase